MPDETITPVMTPWDAVPETVILLCGLVYVTDHDWFPAVALAVAADPFGPYPPIHVFEHDGRRHVVDGRHRTVGRTVAGCSTIRAKVQPGHDETCPCVRLFEGS